MAETPLLEKSHIQMEIFSKIAVFRSGRFYGRNAFPLRQYFSHGRMMKKRFKAKLKFNI
jgi:hypothetical protein